MHIKRTMSQTVEQIAKGYPVVLVTGPRQVGKTTLANTLLPKENSHITLDDITVREMADQDPSTLIANLTQPALIDEVQYAPELFRLIKIAVDSQRQPGMFYLTGSQLFHLMRGVRESLAGRVGILRLQGLSMNERFEREQPLPFMPTKAWLNAQTATPVPPQPIWQLIWQGGFPEVHTNPNTRWHQFYENYLQTYLLRDVSALTQVGNQLTFVKFLRCVAARTAQVLNIHALARDTGIDHSTAKAWLSILETSGLVMLVEPYHTNLHKRLIKSPKLIFLDTGLCAFLTRWSAPEPLMTGAMAGQFFETFVITEILKSYWNQGYSPWVYYYRDRDQHEVDLLIECDGKLHPIEIKQTRQPTKQMTKHFEVLNKLDKPIGEGALICTYPQPISLHEHLHVIPVGLI